MRDSEFHFAFGGAEGVDSNGVVYLVVMKLGEVGNSGHLGSLTKFLDVCFKAICLRKRDGLGVWVGVMG
jgi:hypothetical protein